MYILGFNVIYLFFSQTLECSNRFNVIVLGACVHVWVRVPLFSLLLYVYI